MYEYLRHPAGAWTVYVADVKPGDTHRRRFDPGVTSRTQYTANLYLAGRFALTAGDWRHEIATPATSIDADIPYPSEQIVIETALEPGVRVCVEPSEHGRWERRVERGAFDVQTGDLVVPLNLAQGLRLLVVREDKRLDGLGPCFVAHRSAS